MPLQVSARLLGGALGPSVDGSRQAARLTGQVEADVEIEQVGEDVAGDAADRALGDVGEDGIAQLAEDGRGDAGETVCGCQRGVRRLDAQPTMAVPASV